MNYQIDDEQPGTSAGTDNGREELLENFRPVKVFSDMTVRELKRVYHTYDHYHEWPPSPITTIQSVHMHNSTRNGNRSHWSYVQWIDLWPLHDWPL